MSWAKVRQSVPRPLRHLWVNRWSRGHTSHSNLSQQRIQINRICTEALFKLAICLARSVTPSTSWSYLCSRLRYRRFKVQSHQSSDQRPRSHPRVPWTTLLMTNSLRRRRSWMSKRSRKNSPALDITLCSKNYALPKVAHLLAKKDVHSFWKRWRGGKLWEWIKQLSRESSSTLRHTTASTSGASQASAIISLKEWTRTRSWWTVSPRSTNCSNHPTIFYRRIKSITEELFGETKQSSNRPSNQPWRSKVIMSSHQRAKEGP